MEAVNTKTVSARMARKNNLLDRGRLWIRSEDVEITRLSDTLRAHSENGTAYQLSPETVLDFAPDSAEPVDAHTARETRAWETGTLYLETFVGRRKIVSIGPEFWAKDDRGRSWCLHGGKTLHYVG